PTSGYQFALVGNAIDGGSKWGITIHNSHYGLIKDNVVYDTTGSGIVTEDGSETANVFDHNFVVRVWGTGSDGAIDREGMNDWGWEGSGLWFRGPNNVVRNNVIANTNSFAVTYMMRGGVTAVPIPSAPGKVPSVVTDMLTVPVREFANNEWYGTFFGLTLWNLGAGCCTGVFELPVSTFLNTRVWHVGKWGMSDYGSNRVTFDGWIQRNDVRQLSEPTVAFSFGDY